MHKTAAFMISQKTAQRISQFSHVVKLVQLNLFFKPLYTSACFEFRNKNTQC